MVSRWSHSVSRRSIDSSNAKTRTIEENYLHKSSFGRLEGMLFYLSFSLLTETVEGN